MLNPIVSWSVDSPQGFFVNVTGNLAVAGGFWSGTVNSPSSGWQFIFPQIAVTGGPSSAWAPNYRFVFNNLHVSGKQLNGSLKFTSGGGFTAEFAALPWGTRLGETWTFTGVTDPATWEAIVALNLNWSADLNDYSTWRYSIDARVRKLS